MTTTSPTRYRVHLFARYAELLGADQVALLLPEGSSGTDLLLALRALPGGDLLPSKPFLAVNHAQAQLDSPLAGTDEIALLPPMAGG